MRYVVLCHTHTVDRSIRETKEGFRHNPSRVSTRTMLQCVNRNDAERLADVLQTEDGDRTMEDGPFAITRSYEVAAEIYTSSLAGNRKITLTTSELEMIACEFNRPKMAAE